MDHNLFELIPGTYLIYFNSIETGPINQITLLSDGTVKEDDKKYWLLYNDSLAIFDKNSTHLYVFEKYKFPFTYIGSVVNLESKNETPPITAYLRKIEKIVPVKKNLDNVYDSIVNTDQDFSVLLNNEELIDLNFKSYNIENCIYIDKQNSIFNKSIKTQLAKYFILNNCYLYNNGIVLCSDNQVIETTTYQAELISRSLPYAAIDPLNMGTREVGLPFKNTIIDKSGIYMLLNTTIGNYAHTHMQAFSGIEIFKNMQYIFPDIKIFFCDVPHCRPGESFEKYRMQAFRKFNLDTKLMINPLENPGTIFHIEKLIVPSNLAIPENFGFNTYYINNLKKTLCTTNTTSNNKRYLLSRADISRRDIINFKELADELYDLNFETLVIGTMEYEEQMSILSNAEIVVSPHGGGLTNIIGHPGNLKVFEIFHSYQLNSWYKNLANFCGHKYAFYCVDPIHKHWYSDFIVDVKHVKHCINDFLLN